MLQVPISSFKTEERKSERPKKEGKLAPAEIFYLRKELLREIEQKKDFTELFSKVALLEKSGELAKCESLKNDYTILQDYIKHHQQNEHLRKRIQTLEQEEKLLISLSEKATSADLLETYLQMQLAEYAQELKAVFGNESGTAERVKSLLQRAVLNACLQALTAGNLSLACEIATHWADDFPKGVVQTLQLKISWQFANEQAHDLWTKAQQLFPSEWEQALAWAHAHNQEPDDVLHARIQDLLDGYAHHSRQENAANQAKLLQELAKGSTAHAMDLLCAQQGLPAALLEQYSEVCALLEKPAARPDRVLFLKLYFSSTADELWQAYKNGKISSREYLLARRMQLLRSIGEENFSEQIYCKQLEQQLKEKGFSSSQISRFQYELIIANEPEITWKTIKNLLGK